MTKSLFEWDPEEAPANTYGKTLCPECREVWVADGDQCATCKQKKSGLSVAKSLFDWDPEEASVNTEGKTLCPECQVVWVADGNRCATCRQKGLIGRADCASCGNLIEFDSWSYREGLLYFCDEWCYEIYEHVNHYANSYQQQVGVHNLYKLLVCCDACGENIFIWNDTGEKDAKRHYCTDCSTLERDVRASYRKAGYTAEFQKKKPIIHERDEHSCVFCRRKWQEGERVFHVHHIDHDTLNNDNSNLVTLCPECHSHERWCYAFWLKNGKQPFIDKIMNYVKARELWW